MGPQGLFAPAVVEFTHGVEPGSPASVVLEQVLQRIAGLVAGGSAGATVEMPGTATRITAATDSVALHYEKASGRGSLDPGRRQSGEISAGPSRTVSSTRSAASGRAIHTSTFPMFYRTTSLGTLHLHCETPGAVPPSVDDTVQILLGVATTLLMNAHHNAELNETADKHLQLSLHDQLTGLPNRTLLLELIEHAVHRNRRTGKTLAVFYLDVDRFKSINDVYGHEEGDRVLSTVARRLTAQLRPADVVARLHGDEFVLLCEDLDFPRAEASRISARVMSALAEPFDIIGATTGVSVSIGVVFIGPSQAYSPLILENADAAMYGAKRTGGSRLHVFDRDEQRRSDLERDLAGAFERRELHVVYQPIVHTVGRRITGFEALLRWTHPVHGEVPPATIISVAEQSDLVFRL